MLCCPSLMECVTAGHMVWLCTQQPRCHKLPTLELGALGGPVVKHGIISGIHINPKAYVKLSLLILSQKGKEINRLKGNYSFSCL